MKRILTIILVLFSLSSFSQNTWVTWNGQLYLKQGNDSTGFGEDYWSTMPGIVNAINAKQPPLVSGTNIKTVKGQPILGSGDIPIVWGDFTGTLSNQADLQTALNGKQATLVSGTNIKTINGTDITGAGNVAIAGVNSTITFLPSDVINNNAVANSIADVTGLSFAVLANTTYKFRFFIVYNSAATTTGSRWSINGPATTFMNYRSTYTVNAGSESINSGNASYNVPAASNASSLATGNIAIIEGIIRPSAGGTVIARFASEISNSAITAIASGRSYVEFQIIN